MKMAELKKKKFFRLDVHNWEKWIKSFETILNESEEAFLQCVLFGHRQIWTFGQFRFY